MKPSEYSEQRRQEEKLKTDLSFKRLVSEMEQTKKQYRTAQEKIDLYERTFANLTRIEKNIEAPTILQPKNKTALSLSTAIALLSDVHSEEEVLAKSVNGMNEYNPEICARRIRAYFQNLDRLVVIEKVATHIDNLVLAILGDLLHGFIHEEYKYTNTMSTTEACLFVLGLLRSGLNMLKATGRYKKISVICKVGNHARTTDKLFCETSHLHSYEWLLYKMLSEFYAADPVVEIIVSESLLYYCDIYKYKIRMCHGDEIRYNGGVGTIHIPLAKSIMQWDKGMKADYTFMGHWHTLMFGDNYTLNGSVVGYNAFAVKIKAEPQPPQQAFCLLNENRGIVSRRAIFLD